MIILLSLVVSNLILNKFIALDYVTKDKQNFYKEILINLLIILINLLIMDKLLFFLPIIYNFRLPMALLSSFFIFKILKKEDNFLPLIIFHVYFFEKCGRYEVLEIILELLSSGIIFILIKRAFLAIETRINSENICINKNLVKILCLFGITILFV